MISVEEARARIVADLKPVAVEMVGLAQAYHRVLARPVISRLTVPPGDVSAMDGYAVRAVDTDSGKPLRLIGEAPAGHPFAGEVGPGEAVRIFTGSTIPNGADTVLIQENASVAADLVEPAASVRAGLHIRRKGQDIQAGDQVLPAGARLSVRDIGLAAAAGHPWLAVYRRPRIAILCTGDEIALPGEPLPAGGIANSNALMLSAFVTAHGGEPLVLPIARDAADEVAQAALAAKGADLLLTTGGASVGAYDLVRQGLSQHGFALDFWKIAMRPGKPLIFGRLSDLPVLGLPGNPVSAYVCAVLFLRSAIEVLSGLPPESPGFETVRLAAPMRANDVREDYVRAIIAKTADGEMQVTPLQVQDSGMLRALAGSNALIRRVPFSPAIEAGSYVEILRLDHS